MLNRFSMSLLSIFASALLPAFAKDVAGVNSSMIIGRESRYLCQNTAGVKEPATSIEVSEEDWKKLLEALGKQDWNVAVKLSEQYLPLLKDEDQRLPRLRYIYLFASAGKYSEGNLSYEDLESLAKSLIGKSVVLPYREIAVEGGGGALNFINPAKEGKNMLSVAATNQDGTTIHAFEYFKLKDDFDAAANDGKFASISGTIESIVPNPNKSRALVMRVYFSDSVVNLKK